MVRCGSKNGHQEDTCLKEIKLHAQNMITNLQSTVNIIGRTHYDHLMSLRTLHFDNDSQEIHMSSKKYKESRWLWFGFGFANHLIPLEENMGIIKEKIIFMVNVHCSS